MNRIIKQSGIYRITSTKDGQTTSYIGSTTRSFQERWWEHKSNLNLGRHPNPHLQHAWNKYGEEAFRFIIVETISNPNLIIIREQFWLDMWHEYRKVYNTEPSSMNPFLGRHHTEETKERLSYKATKRLANPENHPFYGEEFSKEHICNLRFSHLGHKLTEEQKQKISIALSGRKKPPFSEEHCRNISKANIGNENAATHYPALVHRDTGEIVPAGRNMARLCRKKGLTRASMSRVINRKQGHHKGWRLLEQAET